MGVHGCVWGYWCAGATILCTERHGGTNMCLIWGSAWPGNFPGHHVLTCMTQKTEKRATITHHMNQDQSSQDHKGKSSHIWDHMSTKPYMGIIYGFQIIYGHRFQIIYGPYMIIYGQHMIIELNLIWYTIYGFDFNHIPTRLSVICQIIYGLSNHI